jgi:phospholipid/cholesterol/gamma-HCH transport system substrate-binding protein
MPPVSRVKWARFRVTAVALVSVIILCTLLYELFGGVLLGPKTVIYLFIPDASGLSDESPVRVDGIDVGRVSTVELSRSKDPARAVKVMLLLYRDRLDRIPGDSVAQISSDSLIGDKFVDITGGTSPKAIAAGGEMIYKDQPELLRSLDLTQFTRELRLVDETLTDIEQGRSQFGKFYQGQTFYDDLLKRMVDLQKAINAAVSTTSVVGGLLSSDRLHRQASDLLAQIDQEVAKVQSGQGAAGKLLRDSGQYDQLLSKTQEFRRSIEAVSKNDLLQSDSAYVEANRTLAVLIQSVDELNRNPQMTTTVVYDNLNGSLKELQDGLRDFRLNPKKYLRLKIF